MDIYIVSSHAAYCHVCCSTAFPSHQPITFRVQKLNSGLPLLLSLHLTLCQAWSLSQKNFKVIANSVLLWHNPCLSEQGEPAHSLCAAATLHAEIKVSTCLVAALLALPARADYSVAMTHQMQLQSPNAATITQRSCTPCSVITVCC